MFWLTRMSVKIEMSFENLNAVRSLTCAAVVSVGLSALDRPISEFWMRREWGEH